MTDFVTFARGYGILIDHNPPIGVWKRYRTTDHPNKRNGAALWMGDYGLVQNWATMVEPEIWKGQAASSVDSAAIQQQIEAARRRKAKLQREAASKAWLIQKECATKPHPYLASKGFPDEKGMVYEVNVSTEEQESFLIIPMRIDGHIVGIQSISEKGEKKFLYGQACAGATYTINHLGPHMLCEGYATALSIRAAMRSLRRRYTIHVCFSAGNMLKVASKLPGGFVVADNDASGTGEMVAKKIGWPYWISDQMGEDFNDFHRRVGLFKASQSLQKVFK
jgi:putative DNA primase/helicase